MPLPLLSKDGVNLGCKNILREYEDQQPLLWFVFDFVDSILSVILEVVWSKSLTSRKAYSSLYSFQLWKKFEQWKDIVREIYLFDVLTKSLRHLRQLPQHSLRADS